MVGILLAGLLLPALGLTALRLLGPDQGLLVRLTAFAPLAVLLYGGALLVGVPRWLRRRREEGGALVPVLLALAGIGLHGWWLAPHWTGEAPAADERASTFDVMTANLLVGGGDESRLMRTAAEHRVDVLVLQEITPESLRELDRLGLSESYPHRAGRAADGTSGTMVFASAPLADVTRLDTEFGSWAMTVRLPSGPVRLLAVHTQPPLGDAATWAAELETVREAVAGEQEVDLVVGDLNASVDHAPFRRVLDDGDLRDAAEQANAGWQPTWPSEWQYRVGPLPLPALVALDHVLVGDRLAAEELTAVRVEGSDHRALVARLVPGPEGR